MADDPDLFQENRIPAHSGHASWAGEGDYAVGRSALVQSLDGAWKFAWSPNAAARPADF